MKMNLCKKRRRNCREEEELYHSKLDAYNASL
jgi:hypothetical protein